MEARAEGAFGLASIATLLVQVMDVKDHAPKVTLITLFSPVAEDIVPGTVIAFLSGKDEALGANGKVVCCCLAEVPLS